MSSQRADLEASPGRHAVSRPASPDFADFYAKCAPRIFAWATMLTGDRDAEDIVQDAFILAYERWEQISSYESPEAWVHLIARHRAVDKLRARNSRMELTAELPEHAAPNDTADTAISKMELAQVLELINKMPVQRHMVLTLRYRGDFSTAEIASILGIKHSTVRGHLHAGRRQLQSNLREPPRDQEP